jgi:hypothetical protein
VRLPSKTVVGDDVAAEFAGEQHDGDAVVGEAVAAERSGVGLEGREVGADADGAVDDLVALDDGVRGLLEAEAPCRWRRWRGRSRCCAHAAFRVHEVDADGVVVEAVASTMLSLANMKWIE